MERAWSRPPHAPNADRDERRPLVAMAARLAIGLEHDAGRDNGDDGRQQHLAPPVAIDLDIADGWDLPQHLASGTGEHVEESDTSGRGRRAAMLVSRRSKIVVLPPPRFHRT